MDFTSRDLQDLMEVIDQRVAQRLARTPRVEYGVVAAISGSTASVNVAGNDAASDGFRIAPRLSLAVGDLVRVVIDPDGDRWIADSLTDGGVNPVFVPADASTPGTDYPLGTSIFDVSGGMAQGYPDDFGTVLTVRRTDFRMWQQFVNNSGALYVRAYHGTTDGWTVWQNVYPLPVTTYTPAVSGGGTATFSTLTGSYYRVGKLVFVRIYFVVAAAGSGTTPLSITTPTTPKRSGMRQSLTGNSEGMGQGTVSLVAFDSGSGAVWDRLRGSSGTNIQGSDLAAGSIVTIQGWYEEV